MIESPLCNGAGRSRMMSATPVTEARAWPVSPPLRRARRVQGRARVLVILLFTAGRATTRTRLPTCGRPRGTPIENALLAVLPRASTISHIDYPVAISPRPNGLRTEAEARRQRAHQSRTTMPANLQQARFGRPVSPARVDARAMIAKRGAFGISHPTQLRPAIRSYRIATRAGPFDS